MFSSVSAKYNMGFCSCCLICSLSICVYSLVSRGPPSNTHSRFLVASRLVGSFFSGWSFLFLVSCVVIGDGVRRSFRRLFEGVLRGDIMTGKRIEDERVTGLLLMDLVGSAPHVHHCPLGNGRHINSACPVSCEQKDSQTRAFPRGCVGVKYIPSVRPNSTVLTFAYLWILASI